MLHPPMRFLLPLTAVALVAASCGSAEAPSTTVAPATASTDTTIAPTTAPTKVLSTTTTSSNPTSSTLAGPNVVTVFFSVGDGTDCSMVQGFERPLAESADPIAVAFETLVAGPTAAEASAGANSFFSVATAGAIRSTSLADGLLIVDFADFRAELSNASTSCGSEAFLASLNATAFAFGQIERVRYTVHGSCNVFYNWLQRDCQDQTRSGPVDVDLDTNSLASGSGCTPGTAQLPDGTWFGYVTVAAVDTIEFDLACWFGGAAAADAAAEDGFESPPPNDYYIRNESSDLRTISAGDQGVIVFQLPPTGGPDLGAIPYQVWAAEWANRGYQPGVWIEISDGVLVEVTEQYQP